MLLILAAIVGIFLGAVGWSAWIELQRMTHRRRLEAWSGLSPAQTERHQYECRRAGDRPVGEGR